MTKVKEKPYICLGDKKELEEITGQEFEYIYRRGEPLLLVSFTHMMDRGIMEEVLYRNFRKYLSTHKNPKIDAIIHYSSQINITDMGGVYIGRAKGTPLRKKKKKK